MLVHLLIPIHSLASYNIGPKLTDIFRFATCDSLNVIAYSSRFGLDAQELSCHMSSYCKKNKLKEIVNSKKAKGTFQLLIAF